MFFWLRDSAMSYTPSTPPQPPPIPSATHSMNNIVLAEKATKLSRRGSANIIKRQQPSDSVVHVTITAAGTVIYTHTATSYSYVPTYSTITGNNSSSSNNGSNGNSTGKPNDNNSNGSLGAIIGGVVGGVAFIALIGLLFFLLRKSKKKKRVLQQYDGGYVEDSGSYFRGAGGRGSVGGVPSAGLGMTSSLPAPRHLVAPFAGLGTNREGDGSESKYYQHDGGYYDDVVPPSNPYPKSGFYSTTDSVTSDSLPSTTVDNSYYSSQNYQLGGGFRHVPNEVDRSVSTATAASGIPPVMPLATEERHVPHLKENIEEPPHSKE